MASGSASNSCFVISAPKEAVEGDTGGSAPAASIVDEGADSVVILVETMVGIVMAVAVVVLLLPLLLFSWLLPLLSVHVAVAPPADSVLAARKCEYWCSLLLRPWRLLLLLLLRRFWKLLDDSGRISLRTW
ncbi:hypothetical protein CSOJ01_04504 [Colletotrichum sojae]|uniref:Uncharacterized protein n=1 Tax=Colletotrichum sojae TaxID=2175907 RepID=A0A8H6MZ76_9PEZI|nr:hypothetical protein CSOJ01_04504 [Colletotrichum sojae]